MKTKEEKNQKFSMLALCDKNQLELVLYDFIRQKDTTNFCMFVKNGYPVTPFILNCLLDFNVKISIEKVILMSDSVSFLVFDWYVIYKGEECAKKFFAQTRYFDIVEKKFDDEDLAKYKFWDMLFKKKRYDLLIENNQKDYLKNAPNDGDKIEFMTLYDLVDDMVKQNLGSYIYKCKSGFDYMLENQMLDLLFDYLSKELIGKKDAQSIEKIKKIINLFYECSCADKLLALGVDIKALMYEILPKEFFVQHSCWRNIFDNKDYNLIDWKSFKPSQKDIETLKDENQWRILARLKKREILFLNGQYKIWFRSFFMA